MVRIFKIYIQYKLLRSSQNCHHDQNSTYVPKKKPNFTRKIDQQPKVRFIVVFGSMH